MHLKRTKNKETPLQNKDKKFSLNSMLYTNKENGTSRDRLRSFVNPHDFLYIINNPNICSNLDVSVIIVVHSSADHFQTRSKIRETWASIPFNTDGLIIKTVFLLANPGNPAYQRLIIHENDKHHDIIQEDFMEHYRSGPAKSCL